MDSIDLDPLPILGMGSDPYQKLNGKEFGYQ
jgi:hypothetical protein